MADVDSASPQMQSSTTHDEDDDGPILRRSGSKRHRAKVGRRLSGRPRMNASNSSLHSFLSQSSLDTTSRLDLNTVDEAFSASRDKDQDRHGKSHPYDGLVSQIHTWLQVEKEKRTARKAKRKSRKEGVQQHAHPGQTGGRNSGSQTEESDDSEAFERLEKILSHQHLSRQSSHRARKHLRHPFRRQSSSYHKLKRGSVAGSSDTDYYDGDAFVPSTDAVLDNSKTMGYFGGASASDPDQGGSAKQKEEWSSFKSEVLRLAHTLKLKGWRRVPLDRGSDIAVERLSGALTNAVYVVSPPKDLPDEPTGMNESTASLGHRKLPSKLLLRIYGPQVEHLIDRDAELQILKRLARKHIGPRLLGTFNNGRFEEFFHAHTLDARDLRIPETSAQIAKRMRELHDGIELLDEERDGGPFVWKNWDKWVGRCEQVISLIDDQVKSNLAKGENCPDTWKRRGLICGVEWPVFRKAVEKYRAWLEDRYGGPGGVRAQLVFAHNDTQYGNILRLEPSGQSPLLIPANAHKRLVVIDFEYASANLPGLEFANHFTEWCYNYHAPERPYLLNIYRYPTLEEQTRFIRSYVEHHSPQPPRSLSTPLLTAADAGPSSSISSFMLESRHGTSQIPEEHTSLDPKVEKEINRLLFETNLWRAANTAQWVAWGIVQAKVPELDSAWPQSEDDSTDSDRNMQNDASKEKTERSASEKTIKELPAAAEGGANNVPDGNLPETHQEPEDTPADEGTEDEEEEEFDYLSYAQERAMLFWGDVVNLGIIDKDELPADLLPKLKIVKY
ncbi:MAG: hypothetical protein M1837_000038 [Sclerophora amabilis]|nr:MAG: hypothetical protein M1837_000038 [Sclerophora amabilis]